MSLGASSRIQTLSLMIISVILYHYAAVADWKILQPIQEGPQNTFYHIIFAEKWKKEEHLK
jgi:hypothetical protein